MTEQELKSCLPFATETNIKKFLIPLNNTFLQFEINNLKRKAAFLSMAFQSITRPANET